VVRIAQYWERRYALKRDEKYDILQTVFSAMFELVNANHYHHYSSSCPCPAETPAGMGSKNMANLENDV
jgi:hypothetical protein